MDLIYLDNNATTPVLPEVREAMLPFLGELFGNPSSGHSFGRAVKNKIEEAREQVAHLIGAHPSEIIFCSGGTEADNLALKGVVGLHTADGTWKVVVSAIEHSAVLNTARHLGKSGYRLSVIGVDEAGIVSPDAFSAEMDGSTAVVSLMHANNETGAIQPVAAVAEVARRRGIPVHTDAVQSLGKIPVNVDALGVDLLSLSAHKIYGPKGVGALFVRRGTRLYPLFTGGSHERGLRAGTENVAGIIGLGVACEIAGKSLADTSVRTARLRDELQRRIFEAIPRVRLNGHPELRAPNTLNVGFAGADGEALQIRCDMEGIAVSTGSACASGSVEPSHVLLAMGIPHESLRGSLRFSLGRSTTPEEIDRVMARLPGIVELARSASRA